MKKAISLLLSAVMLLLTAVFTFSASAADMKYKIMGDEFLLPPHKGVTAAVQYTLWGGVSTSIVMTEQKEGVTWSVTGDTNVSIDNSGLLTITGSEAPAADAIITITAFVNGEQASTKEITVSKDRIFHDFESYEAGNKITASADTFGMRTGDLAVQSEGVGQTANNYVSSAQGANRMDTKGTSAVLLFSSNTSSNGYGKIKTASVVTLEGKFRNGAASWGSDSRNWLFYLAFDSKNSINMGASPNSTAQAPRIVDIRTNYATGGYVIGNYHGKDSTAAKTLGQINASPDNTVIYDTDKIIKGQPLAWGAVKDISKPKEREWITARMTLDFKEGTYSVWADDILIFEDYALPKDIATSSGKKEAAGSVRLWYTTCDADDIAVYTGRKAVPDKAAEDATVKALHIWEGDADAGLAVREAADGVKLTGEAQTISAQTTVANNTIEAGESFRLLAAYYNTNGLVTADASQPVTIVKGTEGTLTVTLNKPAGELDEYSRVKLFLWTADGLKPLTGQLTYADRAASQAS